MGQVHRILHWANRREVAREVTRRGYRVSGETLNRWVRDEAEFPAFVERVVLELFEVAPDTTKEPPPWWATAQAELRAEIEANRKVLTEHLAADREQWREWRDGMDEALARIAGRSPSPPAEDPARNGGSPGGGVGDRQSARPR